MIRAPRRLVVVVAGGALALAACSGASSAPPSQPPGGASASPAGTPAAWMPAGCPAGAPPAMAAGETATVTLQTAEGDIVIKVEGSLGPNAAANFVALAECGAYDGVVFHRIMPGFVVQAGDVQYARQPNVVAAQVGGGGPGYTIVDDPVTTPYGRGTLAMARTPAPNSQGSQFFIVLDDAARASLESANTYAIFGSVTSGMEVAEAIAAGPSTGGQESRALEPVAITKAAVTRP
jgi:cyclophilin family peptidyl-prolyl cis-trans isomerase